MRAPANLRATVRRVYGVNAAELGHALGREGANMVAELEEPFGESLDVLPVVELLLDDDVHDGVEHRHVGAGPELEHVRGVTLQALAAGVHDDQLAAALGELLEIGRRHRVVLGRVGADDDGELGVLDLVEGRRHRRRAHVFHQRRHGRGVAEPCAMVDVVVLERLPDQLLEEIRLLVRAFGRAEARHGAASPEAAQVEQTVGGDLDGLVPFGFAEMRPRIGRVDVEPFGGRVVAADQRLGQTVWMVDVVEPEAALDAEAVLVCRAVETVDELDLLVFDLERHLASHPAERADRGHLAVDVLAVAVLGVVEHGGFHQRAGRAGLDAFAAGDAGRGAHRIVEIEDDLGVEATLRHADHVVDLDLAAGAHAEVAVDAGVEIDAHRDVAVVKQRDVIGRAARKAAVGDALRVGHVPEMRGAIMGFGALRLVGDEHLHDHRAGLGRALALGLHHHAFGRLAHAGGREHPVAVDLDHAGAAIAVGAIAGRVLVAEMRDRRAFPFRHLPDRLVGARGDGPAVEAEGDGLRVEVEGDVLVHRLTPLPENA